MQQRQMALEVMFQRNMALFKKFAPSIYDEYINYQPQRLRLSLDADKHINLVNTDSGTFVYGQDPQEFCQQQVEHYIKKPSFYKVNFSAPSERYFFQLPLISKVLNKFDCFKSIQANLDNPVGVLVVNGCGLGYHIGKLLNRIEVRNLVIFDPHKDSFYASLHTMDWAPIIEYFYRPGKLLKLFIGMNEADTMISLRLMTNRVGQHNISNTYIYTHLASKETEAFTDILFKQFHLTLTGTGFLEDEQVSFAHTLDNLGENIPVLNNQKPTQKLPPAFVVGNGPSLDKLLPFLRENIDKAIIFSCGSTTGTLYKEGITPDFHVEMERIGNTTKRIKNGTDETYRANIHMLALNTVAPESMKLFPKRFMAKKVNDPGEYLIDYAFGEKLPYLNICNPTCTNTGLAYALHMGFKEIYLLGVDLGMKDAEKHHASSSQYYTEDKEKLPNFSESEKRVNIEVDGNFGGKIYTTANLDTSRANMEIAIRTNPTANVYNLNDGAKINGAITLEVNKASLTGTAPKHGVVAQLEAICFSQQNQSKKYTVDEAKKAFLTDFFNFRKQLKLPADIDSVSELYEFLDILHGEILKLKQSSPAIYWILNGSIQSFSTILIRSCLIAKTPEELKENYQYTKKVYEDFISRAYKLFREEALTHHTVNKEFIIN